jgi:hypothetical protein
MPTVNPGPAITQTPQTVEVQTPVNTNINPTAQGSYALRLLGVARGVDANAVADTVIEIINSNRYSVFQVVATNASISLTTATAGLFTAPAAAGTAIVATAALAALTGPTIVAQRTVAATAVQTAQRLYARTVVAQGAAATYDLYVYGYDFST